MSQILNGDSIDIPKSGAYFERPRLHRILEDAMRYPLIVVYAGTGYGKTRAVYSFLQEYTAHTVWMQLSERDNITTRFWENHAHMALVNRVNAGDRFLEIGFPDTDEAFAKFEALRPEVFALPEKYVVVYDDFHLLRNPAVLHFIERASNTVPPNAKVILISRAAPDFNLIGMMMRERVFIIREDTLRFTEDEIAGYFEQLGLHATRQNIREVYEDTQGWAFAINLIGQSLIRKQKYERYALEAMKKNIYKLIESETARIVSKPLWRVLLRISLIDYLSAELIKIIVSDETLIKEMELLNTYIRYDLNLDSYIIHHLFLEYLRQNQCALTDEEKRETYQKAAEWCEANNYHVDSLAYYEKSGDYGSIMRTVYSFDAHLPHDMARYALEIFSRMPESVSSGHPLFPAMEIKLKISLGMFEDASALAEKYAKEYEARPESDEKNRALLGIYYALALLRLTMCPYTGAYDFDIYFKKASEYGDKSPFAEFGPFTSQSVGSWAIIAGDSRAGAMEEYVEAAYRSVPYVSHALNGNMYGFDDLAKGELCYFRQEISDAEKYLKQALEKARSCSQYDIQNRALLYFMLTAFFRGDLSAATAALKSMEELLDKKDYVIRYTTYDIACGFYYITLGQTEKVPGWLKGDFSKYAHPVLLENYANRVKARYHYLTRRYSALMAFIGVEGDRQTALFGKIGVKALESLTLYQLKRRDEAVSVLTQAYNLAEPNNIIMPFTQYGKDMRTLTAAALKDGKCLIPKSWLENINRKSSAFAKRQTHMITEYKNANNIKDRVSLTNRETEILRDLSQGLSRTEIAASQNISVNTVKMAINIIYEKLHASNLPDAIRIAAELKII